MAAGCILLLFVICKSVLSIYIFFSEVRKRTIQMLIALVISHRFLLFLLTSFVK